MKQRPSVRNLNRFAPIYVLAPARSYTSVISMMLGQHPETMGFPELKLFSYATVGELEDSLPNFWIVRGIIHRSPGLIRTVAELVFGTQTVDSCALARAWLHARSDWSGADIMDILLEHIHPRIGVEKSPENVETDGALERLAAAYPRARYIHLTRHPLTTQRSIQQHTDRILQGFGQYGQPMRGIAAWFAAHKRILCFGRALPSDRYLRIRAEDVLNRPHEQLSLVAAWLGLRTDAVAIQAMMHPETSPFACFGPACSGVSGGNDPAFLCDPIPHKVELPVTVDRPQGWSEEPSAWPAVVKLAAELGY